MVRSSRTAIAVLGVCLSASTVRIAQAIDAVYVPGSSPFSTKTSGAIEVQGFNGRIDLPVAIQGLTETSGNYIDQVSGATSDGSTLYTLLTPSSGGTPSVIAENNAQTGAYLGVIQLPGQFSDVAYTNGQLYGIQSVGATGSTQTFAIDSISSTGSTSPVVTQTVAAPIAPTWRLSGAVAGNVLLAVPSYNYGTTSGYVFVPTTSSSPTAISLPTGSINDAVIHADGTEFTVTAPPQKDYSLPDGTLIGPRASNGSYGTTVSTSDVSDEFNYSYPSTQQAAAAVSVALTSNPSGTDGLYRQPVVVNETETLSLQNGVAPDGTTVTNVASHLTIAQAGGVASLPITSQIIDAAAGAFSNRQLSQATVSINLAGATRGIYGITSNANLTGTYTTAGVTQTGRSISSPTANQVFAYDPVSSNLVGNGDGSLNGYGWASILFGQTISEYAGLSPIGFGLDVTAGYPEAMRQILQLPTTSGPMLLSFKYELGAFDPGDLSVTLNGIDLGDLIVSSTTPGTYQTLITNPALEGVPNADLSFNVTDPTGSTDGATYVEFGSISLTAATVPEPTSIAAMGLGLLLLDRRRCKRV